MRWFGLLLALVLLLGAMLAAAATWLLATDRGTQLLGSEVVKRVPGLELGELSGNLIDGVHITRVRYAAEPSVVLRDVKVEVELWPLLDLQALQVTSLAVGELQIDTLANVPADASATTAASSALVLADLSLPTLPLSVYLHSAHLKKVTYDATTLSDLHLTGAWTDAGLELSDVRLASSGIQVDGRVALRSITAAPMDIDLALTWFREEARGRLTAEGPLTRLTVTHRLHLLEHSPVLSEGVLELRDWPTIHAELQHSSNDPALSLSTAVVGSGESWRIDTDGRILGYAVQGQVDADLGEAMLLTVGDAKLAKVLNLAGQVSLQPEPQARFRITSTDVAPLEIGVGGDVVLQLDWQNDQLELALESTRLTTNQMAVETIKVSAQGPINELVFDAQWREGTVKGVLREVLSEQTSIAIESGAQVTYADLRLRNTAAFVVQRRGAWWNVTPHCWTGFGEVCIEASTLSESSASMQGRVSDFPLAVLNGTSELTFADGTRLNGSWRWQLQGHDWRGEAELSTQGLDFSAGGRRFDWLPDATLKTRFSSASVLLDASAAQPGLQWQANLEADGWSRDSQIQGSLRVELDAETLPLQDQDALALQHLQGAIHADAELSGRIGEPRLAAQGTWQQGAFKWSDPALELSEIDLAWQADEQGWQVRGTAQSEQGGALSIRGQGDGYRLDADMQADVASTGLRLQSDMWDVTAIPSAHLIARQGQARFTGQAHIPSAAVTVKTLPTSLPKPVADVRVRGRSLPEANASTNTVQGTLQVSLGDDVRLDLLALAVRLTGTVEAQISGTEVVALHGELTVADGSLSASGQTLKVKEGRILFSGDPNLPYVDLIATRDIKDYTPPLQVGLRISGRADALKTSVYSQPVMNETRALSFLVLGRDFNEASDADSNQLLSAAISLGLSQTQGVVEQLRGALGLDELSALAAEQNDVAIVAGKRITEDLYVRYSYNALSAVSALIIRYHLNERWRLEATNDVNSSMDLLYEFAR